MRDLPRFMAARPAGGQIWVRGDAGPYLVNSPLAIRSGGVVGHPVLVLGVDARGGPHSRPVLVGTRTSPWRRGGRAGAGVFTLYSGAQHVVFRNLAFTNEGTAFLFGGRSRDVVLQDMSASNVQRFVENRRAIGETGADVSGLQLLNIDVRGFSKSVVRLRYNSGQVLLQDVRGDSQQQDGDDFAMGVHLEGTVHDVVLRRVVMRNARDTLTSYWNGDGFATERGVHGVRFEDTTSTGNTDAGYDVKSAATTLVRTSAAGNKRNYRLWAKDTTISGCAALAPVKRGGIGSQAQFWLGAGAHATLTDCNISDSSTATRVFELSRGAHLTVQGGTVTRAARSRLAQVEPGAALQLLGTVLRVWP